MRTRHNPEFGPIMPAKAWLGKSSFSLKALLEKLDTEDNNRRDRTIVLIRRENGQLIAALTSSDFDHVANWAVVNGSKLSWYKDTGNGYSFPSDLIEIIDVIGYATNKVDLFSLRNTNLSTKVTPYVFK